MLVLLQVPQETSIQDTLTFSMKQAEVGTDIPRASGKLEVTLLPHRCRQALSYSQEAEHQVRNACHHCVASA
jgi:hypothetical protein